MSSFLAGLAGYRKTIFALAAAVLTWAGTALVPDPARGDPRVTAVEWYSLAVAIGGVLGVYAVPNELTADQLERARVVSAGYPTRPTWEPAAPSRAVGT